MKNFTIKETLLLFGGLGFMLIWIGEMLQGYSFKVNYFWAMFGMVCLYGFQLAKNERLKKEGKEPSSKKKN